MKCTCPSGGDRTCPDDCLSALYWSGSEIDRAARRKPTAEQLYRQGYTELQIARMLNVSQQQISKDLRGLLLGSKPLRPKGGRPKGSAPKSHAKADVVVALADKGLTKAEIAAAAGVTERTVRREVERELIRREAKAEPVIMREELSMTAQQKLDIAIRQEKGKLAAAFHAAVNERVKQHMDEIILPDWKKKIETASQLYERRRGLMNKETFNTIRRALHPDSRMSISDQKLGAAFDAFMGLEKYLLDEKDSPTTFSPPLPRTWADWEKAKQQVKTERRARRAGGNSVRI